MKNNFSYDYVEVFDGPRPTDPSLGKFCQQGQLITVSSTSNFMFVKFRSDYSRAQGGFHIRYRAGSKWSFDNLKHSLKAWFFLFLCDMNFLQYSFQEN